MTTEQMEQELALFGWRRGPSFGKPACWFPPDEGACYDRTEDAYAALSQRQALTAREAELVGGLRAHCLSLRAVMDLLGKGEVGAAAKLLDGSVAQLEASVDRAIAKEAPHAASA